MRGLLILAAVISLSFAQVNLDCSNVRCASPPVGCQRDNKTCCGYVCPAKCQTDIQCGEGSFCKKDSCTQSATGACTKIPQFCTRDYVPVCGCDGRTYSNGCGADTNAMTVRSKGKCPSNLTKCQTDSQCGEGSFCNKDSCDLAATGVCSKTSHACAAIYKPVCGCDGKTYSSQCDAHARGMTVQSEGKCPTKPTEPDCSTVKCAAIPDGCQRKTGTCCEYVCPGKCQTDSQCGEGSFCKKDSCSLAATGVCSKTGHACAMIYEPVCGCDGKTYSNGCFAHARGMSVQWTGKCPTNPIGLDCSTVKCTAIPAGCQRKTGTCCDYVCPGEKCQTDIQCGQGFFCKRDSCDLATTGACTKTGQACGGNYKPVCGCDGKTYSNKCFAHASGMSVQSTGKCPTKPIGLDCSTVKCVAIPAGCQRKTGTCCEYVCPEKCQTDSQCGEGSFCKKDSCNLAATGVCSKTGHACAAIYEPVCGCDGKTYSNGCNAHARGMSVQSAGQCPTKPKTVPSMATIGASMAYSDQSPNSSLNNTDTPAYAIALLVIGCLLLVSLVTLIFLVVAVARKNTMERA